MDARKSNTGLSLATSTISAVLHFRYSTSQLSTQVFRSLFLGVCFCFAYSCPNSISRMWLMTLQRFLNSFSIRRRFDWCMKKGCKDVAVVCSARIKVLEVRNVDGKTLYLAVEWC